MSAIIRRSIGKFGRGRYQFRNEAGTGCLQSNHARYLVAQLAAVGLGGAEQTDLFGKWPARHEDAYSRFVVEQNRLAPPHNEARTGILTNHQTASMGNEKLTRFLQSTGLVNASQAERIASDFIYKEFAKNSFLLQAGRISAGRNPRRVR